MENRQLDNVKWKIKDLKKRFLIIESNEV